MYSRNLVPLFLFTAVTLSSCAPGLGRTLRVDRFPDVPAPAVATDPQTLTAVRVTECEDARPNTIIATINGRPLEAESSVSAALCNYLRDSFRAEGLRVTQFEGAEVRGVVREWRVKVQPGFPTTQIDASAAVQLFAGGPDGKSRYSAHYRGEFSSKHPIASEELVEENLGRAMAQAIAEALRDDRFRDALAMSGRRDLR